MKEITTIGVDLAKSVFQLHGVDKAGKVVLGRQLRRSEMLEFFQNLPRCLVGIEACASGKTDAADAEAICEAASRPSMRFVPVKSEKTKASSLPTKRENFWSVSRPSS